MHGLLNINKPAGITSRYVVDVVAKAVGSKQVGHAGTLDPLATGVLVLCLGRTTRLVPLIQEQHKEYRAEFLLGCTSDTDDVKGRVTETNVPVPITRAEIEPLLPRFVGRIMQVPPQFSAVVVEGRRAYKQARRGRPVEIAPREVDVFRIDLLSYEKPRLELAIECGSGMYVRAIGRDIGQLLGCGAVLSSLVRTRIGEFHVESASPMSTVTGALLAEQLLPAAAATAHLPQRQCTADDLVELGYGRSIASDDDDGVAYPAGSQIALLRPTGELAALAIFNPETGRLKPYQVFFRHPAKSAVPS